MHCYDVITRPWFSHKNEEIFVTENNFIFVLRMFISVCQYLNCNMQMRIFSTETNKTAGFQVNEITCTSAMGLSRIFFLILDSDVKLTKAKSKYWHSALSFLNSFPAFPDSPLTLSSPWPATAAALRRLPAA